MKIKFLSIIAVAAMLFSCGSGEQKTDETEEVKTNEVETTEEIELIGAAAELTSDQSVSFIQPADGAVLTSPVVVEFAVSGMEVEPAGPLTKNKGHHHIVINGNFIPKGEVVPADETHIHYGKGQTSDTLELSPGEYSLTMQFADGLHNSYGEQMSSTINITVK